MSRVSSLPERLQYLLPFRKKFASRPPEELDEDSGYKALLAILRKRIAGHSAEQAERLLEEDKAALQNWLSKPEQTNDCLHFAAGVFLIASPAELVKQVLEESKRQKESLPWVEMNLPEGIKPRRFDDEGDGGMFVKWMGLAFSIGLPTTHANRPAALHDFRNKVTSFAVQFGKVTGTKFIEIGENRFGRPDKRIIYVLAVPGGQVEVSLVFLGKQPSAKWDEANWKEYSQLDQSKWDETPVESFFHTLRVVMKPPPND